jgi:exo-1,4-beta-D-glucosaminidase
MKRSRNRKQILRWLGRDFRDNFTLKRMNCTRISPILSTVIGSCLLACAHPALAEAGNLLLLENGWQIQSAAQLSGGNPGADGAAISSDRYSVDGWHRASVPTTVLGALVNEGVYTNIYFGTNFGKIPHAPFTGSWWFRNEFPVTREQAAGNADLVFEGINYRANIWLNGQQIAATNDIFGAFKNFKLDASGKLKSGKNTLAVEVFPPQPGDFTMGFVDWNPHPPDGGMGLFRPVKLHFYKAVELDNVFVASKIDHNGWDQAALTVRVDLKNKTDHETEARVTGEIGKIMFGETFKLVPGETRTVELTPEHNAPLNIAHPQLWWPWELGEPHLYNLKLTASANGKTSDSSQTRFGIREVSDYITPDGYRGYRINGRKILIRGGGWADELLLRENATNLAAQLQYTKAMNLNTVRLEGIWGSSQRLYDLADEYGLFVMVGFSCQWEWKDQLGKECDNYGGFKSEADLELATNYLHDQVIWLRNHPSIYVWVVGSDKLPRPELETRYDALLKTIDPTRPVLKTCGDDTSKVSGPSAVKMNGPYDYVTPNYWYDDVKNGGAFGYNTETGPGPQPPPLESLQRMIPPEDLWPIDRVWNFHCARGEFGHLTRYVDAFNNRYGAVAGVDEFAYKSQAANYEAIRPMYEAFAANLPHTTGIIQWMLNPSWPKLFWQLYDYYLVPGGAFFGTKKGAAPVAIIYNYGDQGIYLVNQTGKDFGSYVTTITAYDLNSKIILQQATTNAGSAYGSRKVFDLSKLASPTPVYFLDLHCAGADGGGDIANNFYWLSTKPDVLNEGKSTWYVTPNKSFADMTSLNQLPPATVKSNVSYESSGEGEDAEVTLQNTGDTLAFFIEMRIVGTQSQQSLTPVFWDDNYISLPPHTTKVLRAHFPSGEKPELKLRGWNVKFEDIVRQ